MCRILSYFNKFSLAVVCPNTFGKITVIAILITTCLGVFLLGFILDGTPEIKPHRPPKPNALQTRLPGLKSLT